MLNCPHCREELDHVIVNSKCFQSGFLAKDDQTGIVYIDLYVDATVGETIDIVCPECFNVLENVPESCLFSDEEILKYKQQQSTTFGDEPT